MGIMNPLLSWLLLLTLPIIAFYLLRPRSHKKIAPSTFLWKKAVESIDTEKLDKRLIKNWLFYLQLTIVVMGALLLMQPYFQRSSIESNDAVIVIDSSASMSTTSEEISRLDEVKTTAEALILSLKGNPSLTLYDVNNGLTQLYKGRSKATAVNYLKEIEQSHKALDTREIERTIESFQLSDVPPDVFVFTDHQLVDDETIAYSLSNRGNNLVRIDNVVSRRSESSEQLQIILENFSETLLDDELVIYGEDTLLSIEQIQLKSKEKKRIDFSTSKNFKNYTVIWQGDDDYLLDNTYYLPVEEMSSKKILLQGESNNFLEQVLIILPAVEVYKTEDLSIDSGYDLYVYNGVLPETLPSSGSLLIINPKDSTSYLSIGKEQENGQLFFDINDPIWRHVNLNFGVRTVKTIETAIGKSILSIEGESVISKGKLENHPVIILGFDLLETDFPIRTGFPVFMHNTVTYLLGNLSHEIRAGTVGNDLVVYGEPGANTRELLGVDGQNIPVEDSYELLLSVDKSGLYLLKEFDDKNLINERWIGFNVSREESIILDSYSESVTPVLTSNSLEYRSLKWPLAIVLILLLFIEWWVYYHGY